MELPKRIADAIIDYINMNYIYSTSDDYFESAEECMKNSFNISWSNGGTVKSLYDQKVTKISPETEPHMSKLYEFLDEYFSNELSSYDYESIVRRCEVSSYSHSDFYGKHEYLYKSLHLLTLGEILSEKLYFGDDSEKVDFHELLNEFYQIMPDAPIEYEEYLHLKEKLELNKELSNNLPINHKDEKKLKI